MNGLSVQLAILSAVFISIVVPMPSWANSCSCPQLDNQTQLADSDEKRFQEASNELTERIKAVELAIGPKGKNSAGNNLGASAELKELESFDVDSKFKPKASRNGIGAAWTACEQIIQNNRNTVNKNDAGSCSRKDTEEGTVEESYAIEADKALVALDKWERLKATAKENKNSTLAGFKKYSADSTNSGRNNPEPDTAPIAAVAPSPTPAKVASDTRVPAALEPASGGRVASSEKNTGNPVSAPIPNGVPDPVKSNNPRPPLPDGAPVVKTGRADDRQFGEATPAKDTQPRVQQGATASQTPLPATPASQAARGSQAAPPATDGKKPASPLPVASATNPVSQANKTDLNSGNSGAKPLNPQPGVATGAVAASGAGDGKTGGKPAAALPAPASPSSPAPNQAGQPTPANPSSSPTTGGAPNTQQSQTGVTKPAGSTSQLAPGPSASGGATPNANKCC